MEIFAVGLFAAVLSYLAHNNGLTPVGLIRPTPKGGSVLEKRLASAVSHQSSAYRAAFLPQTVASFLIPARADPLLSSKSVASFFKKLSAFCHQPSKEVEPLKVQHRGVKSSLFDPGLFNLRPSTFDSLRPPNGGFVPDFSNGRSFVIKQIGGFVFQKTLSFQPSAVSGSRTVEASTSRSQEQSLRPGLFNLRPSTFNSLRPPNGGFVPDFSKGRSFVIKQIGGFVFQKNSQLSAISH